MRHAACSCRVLWKRLLEFTNTTATFNESLFADSGIPGIFRIRYRVAIGRTRGNDAAVAVFLVMIFYGRSHRWRPWNRHTRGTWAWARAGARRSRTPGKAKRRTRQRSRRSDARIARKADNARGTPTARTVPAPMARKIGIMMPIPYFQDPGRSGHAAAALASAAGISTLRMQPPLIYRM